MKSPEKVWLRAGGEVNNSTRTVGAAAFGDDIGAFLGGRKKKGQETGFSAPSRAASRCSKGESGQVGRWRARQVGLPLEGRVLLLAT